MSSAKLCLMTAYMMTARFKEGEEAGFEAYRLLPPAASLESRKSVLQEIALSCSATRNKNFLKYLQEYKKVLDTLSEAKQTPKAYSYLLLESLYADYYLNEGTLDEARPHLKRWIDTSLLPLTFLAGDYIIMCIPIITGLPKNTKRPCHTLKMLSNSCPKYRTMKG